MLFPTSQVNTPKQNNKIKRIFLEISYYTIHHILCLSIEV